MLYFRTLKFIILSSLVLLGLSISAANASILYNVDRMVGNGSVSGFIETDGTIGILNNNNITDWKLTLTVPGLSDTIEHGTKSQVFINGEATEATATQLWFDFDVKNTNYIAFWSANPKNFWCLETQSCAGLSPSTETIAFSDSRSQDTRSGRIAFAQISAVPVPAAVWLFGTALIGLVGFSKRRKTI